MPNHSKAARLDLPVETIDAPIEAEAEFLIAVIDAVPARLSIMDEKGFVTAVNEAWRKRAAAIGKPEDYPVGVHLNELLADIPERHARAIRLGYQAVLDGRRTEFSCTYPVGRTGEADWFKQSVSRIPVDGPAQLVAVIQSVQELKRSEQRLRAANASLRQATAEAEDANEAKSSFLAAMGHELRTPLNGVLGMADAMSRSALPHDQRERLQVIRQSGESLMTLLNDLLELSSLGSIRTGLEDGVIDVLELAQSAERVFKPLAQEKGLAFTVVAETSAGGLWKGDPVRLKQVLYKLLSNAMKFTQAGSVAVTLSHDSERLLLAVEDTGVGVPADKLAKIFDSFVQADGSLSRRYGGAGIGLAICHELVTLMQGQISIDSTEGRGSTFTVSLPLVRAEGSGPVAEDILPTLPAMQGGDALRILVAEDNPVNQLVMRTLLAEVGIEPVMVEDGQQAFDAWQSGNWDLVLMDIQMPVMDGISAARLIRETEHQRHGARTPILAVTANAMAHQVAAYLEAGMDGLVSKPINLGLLLEAMDAALNADLQDR